MTTQELRNKILRETAIFPWAELQRQFAAGNVVQVADHLDLIEVALLMAEDQSQQFAALIQTGEVAKVADQQAQLWLEQEASLWTVVIRPWILVQTVRPKSN